MEKTVYKTHRSVNNRLVWNENHVDLFIHMAVFSVEIFIKVAYIARLRCG